ncbi:hypothetical protein [Persicitalea sp.]|uniref:hypothetical protein n=1 Tax=Persicitalea sp. TaxID=3100273 RepID=UPI0035945A58
MNRKIKFTFLIAGLCFSQVAFSQKSQADELPLTDYVAQIDSQFASVPAWLWDLYEPSSGGFYENIAMRRQPERFGPDIQSTMQALNMLADCGYPAGQLPDSVRRQAIHYFQSRQDSKTGFFVDPHYPQALKSERVLGRLVAFSTTSLSALGAAPLYQLPGEQANSSATLWYYSSPDSLAKWLDNLPWQKSAWTAMDAISSQKSLLTTLPEAKRKAFARQMYDYALARQDADGFWGQGQTPEIRLSGTVKFAWFCRGVDLPLPNPKKIYQSILAWYRARPSEQEAFKSGTTVPGNAIGLLGELMDYLPQPFPPEDLSLVLAESVAMTKAFKTPDGGFCRQIGSYYARPDDIAPPLEYFDEPMGDVNGASQLSRVRRWIHALAGTPLPDN